MPRKKVRVSEHDRRKPYQEERTHVDNYVREQEGSSRQLVGAAELGSHETDQRECEGPGCNVVGHASEMVRMPGGEWFCQSCNSKREAHRGSEKFSRSEHPMTSDFENSILRCMGLRDFENFDEVPAERLEKISCPSCSSRKFSLIAEFNTQSVMDVDLDTHEIGEPNDEYPDTEDLHLECASCYDRYEPQED